jgi:hypothetical protein
MRWSVVLLALTGCGGGQTVVHYAPPMPRPVTSMPVFEEPKLDPVRKPDPMLSVDHALTPAEALVEPSAKSSRDVIRDGREASLLVAEETGGKCGMAGDQLVCKYEVGRTYEVYTCASEQTRIELAPGETVLSDFHFGPNRLLGGRTTDGQQTKAVVTFWNLSLPEMTGDGRGNMVKQYFVLPANDRTLTQSYLQFGTNIGPYRLKLQVLKEGDPACVASIRWRHPDIEIQRLIAEQKRQERRASSSDDEPEDEASLRNITCASGAYKFWVAEGSPRWVPTQVQHICVGDHPRVTIQFPRNVALTKFPTLSTDGGVAACRTIPEDYTIVCDNLFSRGMLAMGNEETGQEIVYIQRLQEPK